MKTLILIAALALGSTQAQAQLLKKNWRKSAKGSRTWY